MKRPLSKRPKIGFQDQLSLNAGQKYCRMLQVEHSSILSTFIKLPFVVKIFVLSIFEWPFFTGFTVILFCCYKHRKCTKYETYTILKVLTKCLCYLRLTLLYTTVIFLAQEAFVKACLSKLEGQTAKIINLMWCS